MPGKLVDAGGHRVHIYCTGQGSPTVIVAAGAFSFDWGLVQPKIAQTTRICTYDAAGTAWSDPLPTTSNPNCTDRVNELHAMLKSAGIAPPYIMVGFSIGGLVARLYAARFSSDIAGMVFVDHAFIDTGVDAAAKSEPAPFQSAGLDSPPALISKTPIALDLADDENFSRLPERDQELHRWAMSIGSFRPSPEMAAVCFSEVKAAETSAAFPLGSKPVAVVSTLYDSAKYRQLQQRLLNLSRDSRQFVAENSTHMVLIDQPATIIQAVEQLVAVVRRGTGH